MSISEAGRWIIHGGVSLLAIGLFLPILRGDDGRVTSYVSYATTNDLIIGLLVLLAAGAVYTRWHVLSLIAGVIAAAVLTYDFMLVASVPSEMQLSFAWPVMAGGVVLMIGGWLFGRRAG